MGILSALEVGMANVMSLLRFHINDYCDLETTQGNTLIYKDGSMATILRYGGFRSLIGSNEYRRFSDELANALEQFMDTRAHQIQFVYMRDDDPSADVDRILQPCYETADRLELNISDLLDEKKAVARHYCLEEQVFIVLFTRPSVLDPVEHKLTKQEIREVREKYKVPTMKDAQNVLRPIRFMADKHDSFVAKIISEITGLKGSVHEVEIHEAFCEIKRYLYKDSTPHDWKATLPGDPITIRWKNNKSKDISALMYPRLDDQLFGAPGVNGNSSGDGGLTDTRAVRVGTRIFAPVMVKTPPMRPQSFTALFAALNKAGTPNEQGVVRPIPWSISFLLEGDGLKGIGLRKIISGILSWTSQENRNMVAAAQSLKRYKDNENGTVVKMQITAVTWAGYGDEKILLQRRSKLVRSLKGWGNLATEEESGEATAALVSCVPALSLRSIAPAAAPPLHDATYMLPLSRPASPFSRGSTLLRTLDGKIMPWEVFSDEQDTWITLIFGGPGSGKSVWSNRLNEEMCLLPGQVRLPYICVIDIGISSSGFISLIQDALPENKKHLAVYKRIQNTEKYAINQLDTQLGQRTPIPREREAMKQWLIRLATPASRERPHIHLDNFCGRVIDAAFRRCSDQHENGSPKEFSKNADPLIAKAIDSTGISYNEATKWWTIVDAFFERGMIYEASVAQRYAVPTLRDILYVASDPQILKEFDEAVDNGVKVSAEFTLVVNSAMEDFKIFSGYTQFDVGESRVMALDLQDVVTTGSDSARKQASLMYMAALNAFMRKVSIIKEDLDIINPKYRAYHARRVDELSEDYKRLFCDEYHKTGGDENLRESFLIYGRESRKWQLEIVLASQLPDDFRELANLATTIVILDAGNEQTRGTIKQIFGLDDTEVAALKAFVRGARPGIGATFLAKLKTKSGELSQLFTATSGGLELWGLSTTAEDRTLRNELTKYMPSDEVRRLLKRRFPSGSCKSYVLTKKAESKSASTDGFIDEEMTQSFIVTLAEEMISEWRKERAGMDVHV